MYAQAHARARSTCTMNAISEMYFSICAAGRDGLLNADSRRLGAKLVIFYYAITRACSACVIPRHGTRPDNAHGWSLTPSSAYSRDDAKRMKSHSCDYEFRRFR